MTDDDVHDEKNDQRDEKNKPHGKKFDHQTVIMVILNVSPRQSSSSLWALNFFHGSVVEAE